MTLKYTLGPWERSEMFQKVRGVVVRGEQRNLQPHLYHSCNSHTNYVQHLKNWKNEKKKNWKNDHIKKNMSQNSWNCSQHNSSTKLAHDTAMCPSKVAARILMMMNWCLIRSRGGTSLVAQWLRTHLPMLGTQVRALVQEDTTCHGATKPVCHNYWACALEPVSHNYWAHVPQLLKPTRSRACVPQLLSLRAATTEACVPRAHAPQQEKPSQWEAHAPQRRVASTRCN